jgi:hypothetical protein
VFTPSIAAARSRRRRGRWPAGAERRERLAAARDRLAAEDQARREAQRAKQDAWDVAVAAGKRRGGRRPGDEPQANRAGTEPRANITDPDVRVMRNQKGYVAGYNGQLVVTAEQVIVGAMLSQHPVDHTLLHPLLDICRQQLAEAGIRPKLRTVLADSGYVSEDNFARAEKQKLRLLAPLAKDPDKHHSSKPARRRERDLTKLPATARAVRRMRHHRGRADYKLRARTVEPVFGRIKTCQKLTMMSQRGLDACHSGMAPRRRPQPKETPHPPPQRMAPDRPTSRESDRQPATALQHHPERSEPSRLCNRLDYASAPFDRASSFAAGGAILVPLT